jgi:hypothetical protein
MTRRIYKWKDGEFVQVAGEAPKEATSAFVIGDTFKTPLRHPKTDEMVDSMTRWNAINKEHKLECVGNDLLSKYANEHREKITEERFNDAYEEAYAIETDPFKRNQRINQQREDLEKYNRAQQGRMAPGMSMREIAQMMGIDK